MNALIFATALLLALAVDRYLGEPATRWHPVVWIGNYLNWAGRKLQRVARQEPQFTHQPDLDLLPDLKAYWLAALMWLAGAAPVYIAAWWFQKNLMRLPESLGLLPGSLLAALLLGLAVKPLLAWAMLKSEVLAVEQALSPDQGGSLAAGRERLSWLVSRDVTQLTETEVRESAIETLAENLNDSVVAPIFWFVLLGLPGAALYRFANTADAMWGYRGLYKGQNWEWAGKWAAWADDVLSWMPARITALLLLVTGVAAHPHPNPLPEGEGTNSQPASLQPSPEFLPRPMVKGRGEGLRALYREARRTPSPNSGWPMAAMALVLGVRLHKPGVYVLNAAGRAPQSQDTQQAVVTASKAMIILLCLVLAVFSMSVWLSK